MTLIRVNKCLFTQDRAGLQHWQLKLPRCQGEHPCGSSYLWAFWDLQYLTVYIMSVLSKRRILEPFDLGFENHVCVVCT